MPIDTLVPPVVTDTSRTQPTQLDQAPVLDIPRSLSHFQTNHANRPEPDWNAPITLAPEVLRPLLRSLQQFELGDGGGPDCLIAWNAGRFSAQTQARQRLVNLWFTEEKEHSRLLGAMVDRLGGEHIRSHWSFSAFCLTRRWMGVGFELTVLLLTEIVSTGYYRLLNRHADDAALRGVCRLILRDEAGHVAFHRDRLAREGRLCPRHRGYRFWWEVTFRALGLAAATMLWINHALALTAIGGSGKEYYGEVWRELSRFIWRLRYK